MVIGKYVIFILHRVLGKYTPRCCHQSIGAYERQQKLERHLDHAHNYNVLVLKIISNVFFMGPAKGPDPNPVPPPGHHPIPTPHPHPNEWYPLLP